MESLFVVLMGCCKQMKRCIVVLRWELCDAEIKLQALRPLPISRQIGAA